MRVSRSDVSAFDSTQRESAVTGANAMSSSRFGRGPGSALPRTRRSRAGPAARAGRTGSQRDAGASDASRATFFGPARRSMIPAMAWRQLPATSARSPGVSSTRTSFSASAIVAGEISGPTAGAVPNAGGVPAAGVAARGGVCASACTPVTSAAAEAAVVVRNSRRDLGMVILSVRRRSRQVLLEEHRVRVLVRTVARDLDETEISVERLRRRHRVKRSEPDPAVSALPRPLEQLEHESPRDPPFAKRGVHEHALHLAGFAVELLERDTARGISRERRDEEGARGRRVWPWKAGGGGAARLHTPDPQTDGGRSR